jgi:galactosyl transferase GMA12/MNN10 family
MIEENGEGGKRMIRKGGARVKRGFALGKGLKVALFQFDDRPLEKLDEAFGTLMQMNEAYANKHGHDYLFFDRHVPMAEADAAEAVAVSPYWAKVLLARDLLNDGYDYVMWVDTDAVVNNTSLSIPEVFRWAALLYQKPGAVLVISQDPVEGYGAPHNSGVWIARNIPVRTKAFFDSWLSHYRRSEWTQDAKTRRWTCHTRDKKSTTTRVCPWAGLSYEQGSLSLLDQKLIVTLPPIVMANWDYNLIRHPSNYVFHFMGDYRDRMYSYIDIRTKNKWPSIKRRRADLYMELDRLADRIGRAENNKIPKKDRTFLPNQIAIQNWVKNMIARARDIQTMLKTL